MRIELTWRAGPVPVVSSSNSLGVRLGGREASWEAVTAVMVGEGEDEGMVEAIPKGRVGAGGERIIPSARRPSAVRLEHSSWG